MTTPHRAGPPDRFDGDARRTPVRAGLLTRFDDGARRAIVRAGLLAREAGRDRLDDETLLVALSTSAHVTARLGVPAGAVRDACPGAATGRDRELLATLGIDLDEIRGRLPARLDDPARWRLHRPAPLPLRIRLSGPGVSLVLTAAARKAVEVALNLRGYGTPVTEDGLLRGILADHRTPSGRALTRLPVDLPRLSAAVFTR